MKATIHGQSGYDLDVSIEFDDRTTHRTSFSLRGMVDPAAEIAAALRKYADAYLRGKEIESEIESVPVIALGEIAL